jgi:hypothetical protein
MKHLCTNNSTLPNHPRLPNEGECSRKYISVPRIRHGEKVSDYLRIISLIRLSNSIQKYETFVPLIRGVSVTVML